jgi:ATP-dependent DNA helicase RecG
VTEHQTIEYKQHWRDEYLKWICGFANAQGGQLLIGADDNGMVSGLDDYEKLLDEIPNKTVQYLGLVIDVNLRKKKNKHYIQINVPVSNVPISYHGVFHYRSGSTKQELKGVALQNWLLQKMGKRWEDAPVENMTVKDLDNITIQRFLGDAVRTGRIPPNALTSDIQPLLRNLRLLTEDGDLTHAAILLFGKHTTHQFVTSSFKIGRFGDSPADLLTQDIVEGNILYMADKVLDILKTKYLVRPISYEGLHRKEPLEYPEPALREAILNAIIHKDHSSTYIFLRVYPDKLTLFNPGPFPEGYDIERLKREHSSKPRNRHIADVFFKAGLIEAWGRGITRIIEYCVAAGLPEPIIQEQEGGVHVTFLKDKYTDEYLRTFPITERQIQAVLYAKTHRKITNKRYQELFSISRNTASSDLQALVKLKLLVSSNQKGAGAYYSLPGIAQ